MRLEAQKKMGYYPTPLTVVGQIKSLIHFPSGKVCVLDPCCGEGIAIKTLVAWENTETYGIELDYERAEEANCRLDHVVIGDYRQARITNGVFSMLWLNPPYDFEEGERKEYIFLRDTMRYLKEQGLLIYIIPQPRLDEKIAKILSLNFEDIRAFKFPEKEYHVFKQIVIFGVKKEKPELIDSCVFDQLINIPYQNVPEILRTEKPLYSLPETKPVSLFKAASVDMESLKKSLMKSPLWERVEAFTKPIYLQTSKRPPLPLRTGHIALVLASGYLDGEIGEGTSLHIVKGRVFKEIKESTEVSRNEVIHKKTDVIHISIKILKPDGEIKILL